MLIQSTKKKAFKCCGLAVGVKLPSIGNKSHPLGLQPPSTGVSRTRDHGAFLVRLLSPLSRVSGHDGRPRSQGLSRGKAGWKTRMGDRLETPPSSLLPNNALSQ